MCLSLFTCHNHLCKAVLISIQTVFSAAPTEAPSTVLAGPKSSSSLRVSWSPPPQDHQNGIITVYTVYYRRSSATRSKEFVWHDHQFIITGLSASTLYLVSVSASTSAGEGPSSREVTVKTPDAGKP